LRGQKKGTKEKAARSARKLPAFLAPPGTRKLAGRIKRASGSLSARLQAPSGAAVLGARYGDLKQKNINLNYFSGCFDVVILSKYPKVK